jgi:hypothetical protein
VSQAAGNNGLDTDGDLAESLYRVLATLTRVRHDRVPLPPERLRERLELLQWLRHELAAAESLLLAEYDQARRRNGTANGRVDSHQTVLPR